MCALRGERREVEEAVDGREDEECRVRVGPGWVLDRGGAEREVEAEGQLVRYGIVDWLLGFWWMKVGWKVVVGQTQRERKVLELIPT